MIWGDPDASILGKLQGIRSTPRQWEIRCKASGGREGDQRGEGTSSRSEEDPEDEVGTDAWRDHGPY